MNIPLAPLFEKYGARVVRTGDSFRASCPIHGGQRLSVGIKDGDGWMFNCFACGEAGDAAKFVSLMERCSYREACERLEQRGERPELPPPNLHRKPAVLIACARPGCGRTFEATAHTYERGGKRTFPAESELYLRATSAGWEIAPDFEAAVCPWCLLGEPVMAKDRAPRVFCIAMLPPGHDPDTFIRNLPPSKATPAPLLPPPSSSRQR